MTQCQSINETDGVRFTVDRVPSVADARGAWDMKTLILNNNVKAEDR